MQKIVLPKSNPLLTNIWLRLLGILVLIPACAKPPQPPEPGKKYAYAYLVSSSAEHPAPHINPNFIDGWGIAFGPTGVAWVSAANSGISLVLDKQGKELIPGGVTIPSPGNPIKGGAPSGQLFNGTSDFKLPNGNPAKFIFAGLDGIISGWNGGASAVIAINNNKGGANYTGVALAQNAGSNFLYAANFSAHKIEVYDKSWAPVQMPFHDPTLPGGYSPFNIQNVDGRLFVMYAKIFDGDEVKGAGLGFVDIYNPDGSFNSRFASRGLLNAPWGVTAAPKGFWGDNDGDDATGIILVGNFGDGRITAFDKWGTPLGQVKKNGLPLVIQGLWGIAFPPATATAADPARLYFAAGPDDETHGVFGNIENGTTGE